VFLCLVGDDQPTPLLGVGAARRLGGDVKAFQQYGRLDRPVQVEALAYGACGGEQPIGLLKVELSHGPAP
jgi:hypothetical protein